MEKTKDRIGTEEPGSTDNVSNRQTPGFVDGVGLEKVERKSWILGNV